MWLHAGGGGWKGLQRLLPFCGSVPQKPGAGPLETSALHGFQGFEAVQLACAGQLFWYHGGQSRKGTPIPAVRRVLLLAMKIMLGQALTAPLPATTAANATSMTTIH